MVRYTKTKRYHIMLRNKETGNDPPVEMLLVKNKSDTKLRIPEVSTDNPSESTAEIADRYDTLKWVLLGDPKTKLMTETSDHTMLDEICLNPFLRNG